ncbi:MAG TPA: TIGR02281 family clan AA aspartic protease [Afifellaceae bacterium]|nr:TIGR02281 family clan AA aspartic protease [Afifellaceae bacterium]
MREIVLACAVLAALAVVAPPYLTAQLKTLSPGDHAEPLASGPKREERLAATADRVEVKAGANGHFFIDAQINYSPVSVMVDTGATVVALRRSDAERAGIRVHPADFTVPMSTANGTAHAALVELDSILVANIEVERVRAVVIPDEQLGVSLLGTSFLSRLRRFEIAGDTLIFEN